MKLFELVGVKAYYDKTHNELISHLEHSGFKKLGNGLFAYALKDENNTVYKFWAHDPTYEKYVKFCNQRKNNKHLPKFKSDVKTIRSFFKRPQGFPDKISYVKMELLEKYYDDNHQLGGQVPYYKILKYMRPHANANDSFENSRYSYSFWKHISEHFNLDPELKEDVKYLYETMLDIATNVHKINDLHDENFMMRGDIPVITDPIANEDSIQTMNFINDILSNPKNFTLTGPTKTK